MQKLWRKSKKNKFNNEILKVGNLTFDSKKEYERYLELSLLQGQGKISELKMQVKFELARAVKFKNEKRTKPPLRYYADFTYIQDGQLVVEDVKSAITRKKSDYRIKKHLMMTVHNIEIVEK